MNPLTIAIIVLVVLVIAVIGIYNGLIRARLRAKEALSDIDVQSKRRYDLIPNLIETVKGYVSHEKNVLENVTAARTRVATGGSALENAQAENALSATLKTLFAVLENYPQLKANENFLELQRELSDTENKMQAARRFYNSVVQDLNAKVQSFPSNIIARTFSFHEEKFFELSTIDEAKPVAVKF
ncbi:MAG: LemA family protein [bacterium]|nr:LemA family protein [bacterium]